MPISAVLDNGLNVICTKERWKHVLDEHRDVVPLVRTVGQYLLREISLMPLGQPKASIAQTVTVGWPGRLQRVLLASRNVTQACPSLTR